MYLVDIADPRSPDSEQLLAHLSRTLERITGSSGAGSFRVDDFLADGACFAVARTEEGVAVGCGALRPLEPGVAELKRMFAVPGFRGVGSAVLEFLERRAALLGYGQVWLETRRVNLRAVAFYARHGYRPIANFGRYASRPEAVCLAKTLTLPADARPGFKAWTTQRPAG